jgi:hypothetical protein
MSGYWINSKGKKFIGDSGIVPAADAENPNVVSYEEWNKLAIEIVASGSPSESLNDSPQVVPFTATMTSPEGLQEWTYDMAASVAGIDGVEVLNVVKGEAGISADLQFPVDIIEGQVVTLTCMSGGRVATLEIAVEA